jgi:predicted ATP-binding protein involved in virulence
MKIKEINFFGHSIFKNHKIVFGSSNIPMISYLVGNNGSGKTKTLDIIYQFLGNTEPILDIQRNFKGSIIFYIELNDYESAKLGDRVSNILLDIQKTESSYVRRILDAKSQEEIKIDISELIKIVYSTVEVNFNAPNISNVTSKDIDSSKSPKERSINLSLEIPQLLIDIKSLDDADVSNWVSLNNSESGMPHMPVTIGNRLNRFKDAFHQIYDGEKIFHDIANSEGTKKIIFKDKNGVELNLSDLSTGEKQIIYRIGYVLKELGNLNGGIILIDEPEISLHPKWQLKLNDFLIEIFKGYDVQIIIATHSPYVISNLKNENEACIKIDRNSTESRAISLMFTNLPYTPSSNLINYIAYDIPSPLLHVELYTLLQIREKISKINKMDQWFQSPEGGCLPIKHKIKITKDGKLQSYEETKPTWIRNKIHHYDESARPSFNEDDLRESINNMIELLQS